MSNLSDLLAGAFDDNPRSDLESIFVLYCRYKYV
jgi:hypothetical protein